MAMGMRSMQRYNSAGITLRGLPLAQLYPGKVFWVGTAATTVLKGTRMPLNTNDGSFNAPFATIDYAIGRCTASRGDIIFVKPGHTETISNATGTLFDVAGVAIVGLGTGSMRPTLTFTATSSNIPISVANVSITNILFVATTAVATASIFTVSGTALATDFTIENCEFREIDATGGFTAVVTGNGTAQCVQGLYVARNRYLGNATTAGTTMVKPVTASNRIRILDNYVDMAVLNDTAALLDAAAVTLLQLEIARNVVYRPNTETGSGGLMFMGSAGTWTGHIYDNYGKVTEAASILVGPVSRALGFTNNLITGATDASGFLLPAVDNDGS